MQRLAAGDWTDADLEPVLANAADEALAELWTEASDVPFARGLRNLERDRRRSVDVDGPRARVGNERVTVAKSNALAVSFDHERPVERRRRPERHLDLVRIDEPREPTAGVASVRRRERTAIAVRERDLHLRESTD